MATQSDYAIQLQKQKQQSLKYRTKIIELENDLSFMQKKSSEYEQKYKQSMLQNKLQDSNLLEKLTQTQNEVNKLRSQLLMASSVSNIKNSDLIALAEENQQLVENVQEIKNAAMAVILAKDEEIEELNRKVEKYEDLENQLKLQYERYEDMEKQYEIVIKQKQEEISEVNVKILKERDEFLGKLESFQKEVYQEELQQEKLIEKTHDLEGNLLKSEEIIESYDKKIYELENNINKEKMIGEQEKTKLTIKIEQLKQQLKVYERDQKNYYKELNELKNKQKSNLQRIQSQNDTIQELSRKISIKKRKQNKTIADNLTRSFSHKVVNNVFATFIKPKQMIRVDELPNISQLQEGDQMKLIENFSLQDIQEPEMSTTKNKEEIGKKDEKKMEQEVQASIAQLKQKWDQQRSLFEQKLQKSYTQSTELNKTLQKTTTALQNERKQTSDLRSTLKKSKKESQLTIQIQSLNIHVEKLQTDMLTSKLKFVEELDFVKERSDRQRLQMTGKIIQLSQKIAQQDQHIRVVSSPKKKKGFFG